MGLAKVLIDKATGLLNVRTVVERKFFDVPLSMKAIRAAAGKAIQLILNQLKEKIMALIKSLSPEDLAALGLLALQQGFSDDDIKKIVKTNKNLRNFKKELALQVNENIAPEVTVACFNEDFLNEKLQKMETALSKNPLDANDYLRISLAESDFDEKINTQSQYNGLEDLFNKIQSILPWLLLSYELFLQIKDYITSNRFPSTFRANYLQNLIRQFGVLLNKSGKSLGATVQKEVDELIGPFKSIDNLIIGLSMAAFIYLKNRGIGQQVSTRQLAELSTAATCEPFVPSFDVSINATDISINLEGFTCPVPDQVIVPHVPIDIKLRRLDNCDVQINEPDSSISADPQSDLANNAILQNLSTEERFEIYLHKDQGIEFTTPVGKIGETLIYSSVTGIVSKIEPDKIWIRDISDVGSTLLELETTRLKALYAEMNESKRMIKDFYLLSWYLPMLASTPFVDPSVGGITTLNKSIRKRWKKVMKRDAKVKKSFNKNAKKTTKSDNIKTKAENEDLNSIKDELDKLEVTLFKNLDVEAQKGINKARITKIDKNDLIYFDYLLDLVKIMVTYDDQNDLIVSYTRQLNRFLIDRFFVESRNLEEIEEKINVNCLELDVGNFSFTPPPYYNTMTAKYLANAAKNPLKSVEDFLVELGKNNNELDEIEKDDIVKNTLNLFEFSRNILDIQNDAGEYNPPENIIVLSFDEGNYIKNFFGQLKVRIKEIPEEIIELEKKIDDLGASYVPPAIINIDDEDYEWYGLKSDKVCPEPEPDEGYLSPVTQYNMGDIEYWLRYSAFATLASVANPGRGWATGFPPPIGPLMLPVVYIPFKSFMTKWGFIVVGLTICGVFPFPWVLFGNLSTNYNTPIGDPTAAIKNEIQALKKALTNSLKQFKQGILEDYLQRQGIKVEFANDKVDTLTDEKREHKLNKPKKDRTKTKPADRQTFNKELNKWKVVQSTYTEEIIIAKGERFAEETKYKIVYDAFTGVGKVKDSSDPKLIAIEKTEQSLDKQRDKLDASVDQVDKILIPLPIAMKPDTANFALTAKNPKPIIKIKEGVVPEVKGDVVQKIIDKSSLDSEDFMNSKFKDKVSDSLVGNFDKYKSVLNLAKYTMVPQEAFPKYENLLPTNIAWIPFLYNNFVVKGAQTYGIPGFPPFPIG